MRRRLPSVPTHACCAVVFALSLIAAPAMAQRASDSLLLPDQPGEMTGLAAFQPASLSRSALKALTYKASTVVTGLVILSLATGGVTGGAVLTAGTTVSSWMIYTANDYLWDRYDPETTTANGTGAFDTDASLRRSGVKFLTYKPITAAVNYAAIYAYTGSAQTTLIFGTASAVANAAMFFANNVAWDLYDWYNVRQKRLARMIR